jgi:basic membrane protein A and related proteins
VPEGPDAERVIERWPVRLQHHLHHLLRLHGPDLKVAKKFPDVKFEHATGYKRPPNVGTYNSRSMKAAT